MKSFTDIGPQKIIDEFCAEFRRLDEHLASPKHGLPESIRKYWISDKGKNKFKISKYFRNVASLDKFEALIERLDSFFVVVQYFKGEVQIKRHKEDDFSKQYKDTFFISIALDSLRSSLDIYSKFIAWYFAFPNKNEIGFAYKNFIQPLKKYSPTIANACNEFYKSDEYNNDSK